MMPEELSEIVAMLRDLRSDTADVEAKRAASEVPRSLKETISAFANTRGGVILLGLDEGEGFAAVGVNDPAQAQSVMGSWCSSEVVPPVRADIEVVEFEGVKLVVVEVPMLPVDQQPCRLRSNSYAYRRTADGDQRLSDFEVQMLIGRRSQPKDDLRAVPEATLDDLFPESVSAVVARLRQNRPGIFNADTPETSILRDVGVLVQGPTGDPVPSLGGLLALGRYPQRFFPQLNLTFIHYPTVDGADPTTGERFRDSQRFDGSIPVIVRDALDAIRRNMKRRSVVRGEGREDHWEYPEPALREAIVNGLVHRDLSEQTYGAQVQVEMFPDRLVVRSPGGLYGPVTVSQLGEATTSSARNAWLMRLLEDVPVPGRGGVVCENVGSGIRVMVQALRQAGMSAPEFRDQISSFEVVFPNHSLLNEEVVSWIGSLELGIISDAQSIGLAMLHGGETLTNSSYRLATRVDSRQATQDLRDLADRGVVVSTGQNRWARYHLADRAAPGELRKRASQADRRAEILRALGRETKSRTELESMVGLKGQGIRNWLKLLQDEGRIKLEGKPQSNKARYYALPPFIDEPVVQLELDLGGGDC